MIPFLHAGEPLAGNAPMARRWFDFFSKLTSAVNGPFPLRSYLLADLPANPTDGWTVYCSDAGGGGVPVYARGGQWLRYDTNGVVT